MVERIAKELHTPLLRPLPQGVPHKILSIDMGIRNLALCHFQPPPSSSVPVKITGWERLAVCERPDPSSPTDSESFAPIDLAAKAYTLIKQSLEKYDPHTILIERQRYRSSGGTSILEWTLRVNMLEAMFHAVLYSLSEQRVHPNFVVHSVSPRSVTQFWLADIEEKLNSRQTKLAKIEVAKDIIAGKRMPIEFLEKSNEVAKGFSVRSSGEKKLDDLADSLLQGLAWLQWDTNRKTTFTEIMSTDEGPRGKKTLQQNASTRIRSRVTESDMSTESDTKSAKKNPTVRRKKLPELF